jgi:RNA polymerase sigma factor (sigma-70 family)
VAKTEDDGLLERLRSGDTAAFDCVYAAEKAGIYGFLLRLSRDRHVASDLFQNVWLKLAKGASQLRPESNVRAWLYTIARREYLSYRRAQAFDASRILAFGLAQVDAPPQDAGNAEVLALEAALARLSDADREVLLLSGTDAGDSETMAEILGISAAALRQRLARARRRLSHWLEHQSDVPPPLDKRALRSR